MGRPIPAVQVLNRAVINDYAKYRYPNPTPEQESILKNKLNEREIVLQELLGLTNPSVKDKEKITFLVDSERRIHGGGKNIIDHYTLPIRYE